MTAPPPLPGRSDVLAYWQQAGPARWFSKNAAFDADFRTRFEAAHTAAAQGELTAWEDDAAGMLALLILLDQFPRNAYRETSRMFATDAAALELARRAVTAGLDRQAAPELRRFFYLPFMHAENLADQERCVELSRELGDSTLEFALEHRDIIARFGRFPHRNAVLGRASTDEERRFLDEGGFAG